MAHNFEHDVRIPQALVDQWMEGEITTAMYSTMTILYRWAKWDTGVVRATSAGGLYFKSNGAYSIRAFQEALRKLEAMGWVTIYHTQGSRNMYPVVINNYKWCDDAGKVHILNPKELKVYGETETADGTEDVSDDVSEGVRETSGEASGDDVSETSGEASGLNYSVNKSPSESQPKSQSYSQTDSQSLPETAPGGGQGKSLGQGPASTEELDRFKGKRLGEWETGIIKHMVEGGSWGKADVGRAIRLVLNTPGQYPDGITFPAFQALVESSAVRQ
jgi:hypothetical protein